jgi:hypothetical protein
VAAKMAMLQPGSRELAPPHGAEESIAVTLQRRIAFRFCFPVLVSGMILRTAQRYEVPRQVRRGRSATNNLVKLTTIEN